MARSNDGIGTGVLPYPRQAGQDKPGKPWRYLFDGSPDVYLPERGRVVPEEKKPENE